jgi:hypothetical protein
MAPNHSEDVTDTSTDAETADDGNRKGLPIDRRSYLKYTASAIGASAVGGAGTSDLAAASHVTDLEPPATEADIPGDEPIDRSAMTERRLAINDGEDLSSYVANSSSGELLVVPEGTYQWNNRVTHSYTDWGLRGEWGGDVRIVVQDGWGITTNEHWLVNVDNGDNVLVENLRIDTETHDGRATPGFRFFVPNTGLIHHVIWMHKGPKSDGVTVKSRTLPYAQNASGHVMLDGLVINNRGNVNYNNTGDRVAWSACDGKLTFRNIKASGFGDNIIYTRMGGEMVVENCVFANTTPTSVRLGGANETIRDCTFWVDTNRNVELYNLDGSSVNTSPVMADNGNNASNGGYVENSTFVVNSTPNASGVFRYLNNDWIAVSDSQVLMDDPGVPGTNLGDSESITWTNVSFDTTNDSGATVAPNPDATYNTTSVCVDYGLNPGAIDPDSRGCNFDSSKHHPFPSDGDLTLPDQYGDSSVAVTTDPATSVDGSSATLNGSLDSLGGADSADCYFEWCESGASTWNATSVQTLSATGSFSEDLTGLSEGTEYEFRAVADASDGDSDTGATRSFVASDATGIVYRDDAVAVHADHYDTDDRAGVEFTVTNEASQQLTLTHVTVAPHDSTINELHDEDDGIGRWVSEVHVDADVQDGVCDVGGSASLPNTFDLANDGWSDDADEVAIVSAGSAGSVALGRFEADGTPIDMVGEQVDIDVDYTLDDGQTGSTSFTLDVESSSSDGPTTDTHTYSFDHNWRTQSLAGSYSSPVVIAKPISSNGGQPAHTRLGSVSSSSFDSKVEEWEYLDGSHIDETVSSLTLEEGTGTTDDGTPLEAGTVTTTDSLNWASISFAQSFATAPVVVSQVQTSNGGQAVVTRNRNVSTGGFDTAMQEEQALGAHIEETIGYVAVEPATGTLDGAAFEAGTVSGVDDTWTTISFSRSYTDPIFLAGMQTVNGDDPCALRYRNLTGDSVEVFVEEEGSADDETTHANAETVGFLVVENS